MTAKIQFYVFINMNNLFCVLEYCYHSLYIFRLRVRFGRNSKDFDEFVVTKRIRRVTKHPKYRRSIAYYDIAVVEIDNVEFNDQIAPGIELSFRCHQPELR